MNIDIHSYIYYIYNTRPVINNFMIVIYRRTKYSRQQNLVTDLGSTADVCQPVAEPVSKCIPAGYLSAYLNMTRRLAHYHPVTKRVSTFSADGIVFLIYYSYLFTATIY